MLAKKTNKCNKIPKWINIVKNQDSFIRKLDFDDNDKRKS